MEEGRADLEHASEAPLGDPTPDPLASGVERELRGAADEELRVGGDLRVDRPVRRHVDAERLLTE